MTDRRHAHPRRRYRDRGYPRRTDWLRLIEVAAGSLVFALTVYVALLVFLVYFAASETP